MIANKHEEGFEVVSWINFLLQSNPFYAVTLLGSSWVLIWYKLIYAVTLSNKNNQTIEHTCCLDLQVKYMILLLVETEMQNKVKKNVSSSINCWCLYEQNDTDALLKKVLEMPILWTREMSSRETIY